jgi:hypothetical protein
MLYGNNPPVRRYRRFNSQNDSWRENLTGRRGMDKHHRNQIIELRIFGLPRDTDIDVLARKALDTAAMLEEMGTFDQREYEPAHIFCLSGEGDK